MEEDVAKLHKPSHWKDYLKVGLFALFWVIVLGVYLWIRRGYMFDAPSSAGPFYVPNKVMAGAGLMLLGFVFLIGPLVRYFDRFDFLAHYRKEMGIVGALMVASHPIVSVFFISKKFSGLKYFLAPDHLWTFIAGLIGLILLVVLIFLSFSFAIRKLGGERWWFLQRWGLRLVILFSALHVIPMKWAGWQTWFVKGIPRTTELANPQMTPASILATLFFVWVIFVRVFESIFIFHSLGIATKEVSLDPVLRRRGKRLVVYSFVILLILYLIILFRWAKF